ncbi:MAG TPA: BTAD domain-containing putative transcriptional regulator [Gaiellaceae bacterium]
MATGAAQLEFRLLGPFEVLGPAGPLSLGGRLPRAMLADLVLHRGQVVSVDRLIEDVWSSGAPARPRRSIEVHVSQLRKAFGPDAGALVTRVPGYRLDVAADRIDASRFERLLADGHVALEDGDAGRAAATLREALALWRGPALDDFTYEPFAQEAIYSLEERRLEAVELRIAAELALGQAAGLVGELEALVSAHPQRERFRGQLMLALYCSGRQRDALAAYREGRETLLELLGLEPGPELRELEAAVLRQDETLCARPAPVPASGPKRRLVTVLFCDVVEWTALAERLDAETLEGVMQRYAAVVTAVVERHGGDLEKFVGDAAMAVFGSPVAHEDDALQAARAALELRDDLGGLSDELEAELGVELSPHLGMESGEVVATAGSRPGALVMGDAVGVASRLQAAAAPGEILVGPMTTALIAHAAHLESLGEVEVRGRREPVPTSRLTGLADAAGAVPRRLDAPLVGRGAELEALQDALAASVGGPALEAVVVVGTAGIGKSRLARELAAVAGEDVTVLSGRCASHGKGMTYWPLRTVIGRGAGGLGRDAIASLVDGPTAEALAAVVSPGEEPANAQEIPWAFRRFCESLARRGPVLLVLDDLHWAEPAFLDLVERLVAPAELPLLVVCLAREDLLQERPDFLAGRRVVLDALAPEETRQLVDQLVGESALAAGVRAEVVEAAEGNPLFLEQLVAHVADSGGIVAVPPTLRALLAARLDRLGPGERAVLERAAVVGREFAARDVEALLDGSAAATARSHLETLVRRGFLVEREGSTSFETRLRFRHGLIRDAAYRATPKRERADLHERFARLLDDGLDELVGYHLEQAVRLREELAPRDRATDALAEEAGEHLGSAGIRVWKSHDAAGASRLLTRAVGLLPVDAPLRRELMCELGVALGTAGEPLRAEEMLAEAVEVAQRTVDRRIELRARIELTASRVLTDTQDRAEELLTLVNQALPELGAFEDDRALGRAWMLAGWVHGGVHGLNKLWEESAERARVHYRQAAWPVSTCLAQIAAALYYGPTPVPQAIRRCEELLQNEVDDRAAEANVLAYLAGLEAMRGRFERCDDMLGKARRTFEELGQPTAVALTYAPVAADAAVLSGDARTAELALRDACTFLEQARHWSELSVRAADLAEVLYVEGDLDAARTWMLEARTHASSTTTSAIGWRLVDAKLRARHGDAHDAEPLAREAFELAESIDAIKWRARARNDLGEIIRMLGRDAEADRLQEEARAILRSKQPPAFPERTKSP